MKGDDEALSDYFDGRMPPAERAAFARRLAVEPVLERRLRLLKAMRESLRASAPAMPADLKAALKREARGRGAAKRRSSLMDALRSSFGCGLGAAFAAAVLAFAVRLTMPGNHAKHDSPSWNDGSVSEGLKSLWNDDDGSDRDEG
jgi:anti-sigma factor RsiW